MIETERLILRKWQESDLDDLYEYSKDERVGPSAGWKVHENIEESICILEDFMKKPEILAIELKENNKVIGSIGMHDVGSNASILIKEKSIGYVLHPDYWGRGIVPEAVDRILEYGFLESDVDIFWCGHFDYNHNSKRVIEKCGFKYRFGQEEIIEQLGDKKVYTLYYMISRFEYINKLIKDE